LTCTNSRQGPSTPARLAAPAGPIAIPAVPFADEIEVSQRWALRQYSCKALRFDPIVVEIKVSQRLFVFEKKSF
jgi:hypothetical protein